MLRMEKQTSISDRLKRVDEVMKEVVYKNKFQLELLFLINFLMEKLNLEKCQNNIINVFGMKGISGGEKRRLSFATEVLFYI